MEKMKCTVCGYIYDPDLGVEDTSIAKGTSFEQLPQEWLCPVCGASKDAFEVEK
ncbi:MAG: rubredoxin [Endomicrobium sp.]|jgi:rubredoxin|nr:rubredoxin [Endomicrobium sp.]